MLEKKISLQILSEIRVWSFVFLALYPVKKVACGCSPVLVVNNADISICREVKSFKKKEKLFLYLDSLEEVSELSSSNLSYNICS
jgi:hypothetical protein